MMDYTKDKIAQIIAAANAGPNPWGKRRLNRYRTVKGKRYQLHATRGWKVC